MPSKSGGKDFSQIGYLKVIEEAANTLTFNGLSVFSNVLGQKGMIIHRIEYFLHGSMFDLLVAAGDGMQFGLSGSDSFDSIDMDKPEIYDVAKIWYNTRGTAGNAFLAQVPIQKDFSELPGNGLLVPADRLYGFVQGGSLASGVTVEMKFWFDIIDLSASDYLELAQSMRVLK